jgi:hypothetical protein
MPVSPKALLFALPALVLLAGCAHDSMTQPATATAPVGSSAPPAGISGTTAAPGPTRMTAAEIESTLKNHTATGVARNGQTYYAYFGPHGQVRFQQDDIRDTGTWRIMPDGRFCSQMTRINDGAEQCYTLYRNGQVMTFDRPDGTPIGSFTALAGNPRDL